MHDRPPPPPTGDDADDPALLALRDELVRLFRAMRRARGHGNQHVVGPLSLPQFHLIEPLLEGEPLPVGQLAELAALSAPTATAMVRKLEDQELLERSPDPADRRVVRVALTARGREVALERQAQLAAWRLGLAATVEPGDREAGARALGALADGLERTVDELSRRTP